MKKTILILFMLVFSEVLFSQNSINNDVSARIGTYINLNPGIFNLQVKSEAARAAADVITKAFTSYQVIPNVSLAKISDGVEVAEINRLISDLSILKANPPSWDQIVEIQTRIETPPPTAPVFAGDAAAKKYYNAATARKTRNTEGKSVVPASSSASHEKIIMNPPK